MASVRPAPLLERQRIFGSRDADEARSFLRSKEFRFDLSRGVARQLDLRINGIYLPGVYVGYIQYGSPAEIRTSPAYHKYWLELPLHQEIEFGIGGQGIACGPNRAAVSSPTRELVIRTKGIGARLNVAVTAPALTRQLACLLGEAPAVPLELAPVMDLTAGYGRSLAQQIRLAVMDFQRAGWMRWDAITVSLFEQFIVTRLLLSHPNNYTERLRARERGVSPRDLRRALEYIEANLGAPITVLDIAEASGVAGRTLFHHFRQFLGTSPMGYLREARFAKVRGALQHAEPGQSVARVAAQWGFSHLGRFAIEYRKRFGESPSSTMQRGRRR
jgi:AraC-like DNA-binding protein